MLLNVGCGAVGPVDPLPACFRRPGWCEVRLDIDPGVEPDIVASITDMSAIRSDSVDALWSSHNLEHLYNHEVAKAMAEFRRVLKPEGFVYLKVPDLQAVAEFMVKHGAEQPAYDSPAGPIAPLDMIYGLRTAIAAGHHYMAHRTGFTPHTLERELETAGFAFSVMKRKNYMELSAVAFKTAVNGSEGHARIMAELGF